MIENLFLIQAPLRPRSCHVSAVSSQREGSMTRATSKTTIGQTEAASTGEASLGPTGGRAFVRALAGEPQAAVHRDMESPLVRHPSAIQFIVSLSNLVIVRETACVQKTTATYGDHETKRLRFLENVPLSNLIIIQSNIPSRIIEQNDKRHPFIKPSSIRSRS